MGFSRQATFPWTENKKLRGTNIVKRYPGTTFKSEQKPINHPASNVDTSSPDLFYLPEGRRDLPRTSTAQQKHFPIRKHWFKDLSVSLHKTPFFLVLIWQIDLCIHKRRVSFTLFTGKSFQVIQQSVPGGENLQLVNKERHYLPRFFMFAIRERTDISHFVTSQEAKRRCLP